MTAWRVFVMVITALAMGSNLVLLVQGWRHRHVAAFPVLLVWYPLTACASCALVLVYRLAATAVNAPANPRDFTALIPSLGFLVAGYIGTRALGHRVGIKENAIDLGQPRRRIDD